MVIGCHLRVVHSSLFAQSIKRREQKKIASINIFYAIVQPIMTDCMKKTDLDINILQLLECLWLILLSDEYKIKN